MVRVASNFNIGDKEDITIKRLVNIVEQMYIDLAEGVNSKPDLYERDTDGQVTDTFLSNGSININSTTNKIEILSEHTDPTTVVWTQIS